jgi:hypothetical protein
MKIDERSIRRVRTMPADGTLTLCRGFINTFVILTGQE